MNGKAAITFTVFFWAWDEPSPFTRSSFVYRLLKKNVSEFGREDQIGSDQIVRFLLVLQAFMISPEQVNISKQFAIFADP